MTMPCVLYGRRNSGSLVIQVALEEIGVPYEIVWVSEDASVPTDYRLTGNPLGRVPALKLPDGSVIFESAAILIHLAAAYPEAQLAPTPGCPDHAHFLQWMVYLSANVYEAVLRMYYPARYSTRAEADAEAIAGRARSEFVTLLALIVDRAVDPWVLGDRHSIADAYLYMLVSWYPGDKAALFARFPTLAAHSAASASRASVQRAEAQHAG